MTRFLSRSCLLLFLFFLGHFAYPKTQDTELDLRDYDLDNKTIDLNENWQYHVGKLLGIHELDTAHWELTNLPKNWTTMTWKGHPVPLKGLVTYRKKIVMPTSARPVAMKLYESLSAHQIFVNGKLIATSGKVGWSKADEIPDYNTNIITIPGYFHQGDTLDILVHVSNWNFLYGGIKVKVTLGGKALLEKAQEKKQIIDSIMLGLILLVAISQIIFFVFRKKEYFFLYLALFAICLFLRFSSIDEIILRIIYPELSHSTIVHFRWLCTYLAIPILIQFSYSLFPTYTSKKFTVISWIIASVHVLALFVLPFDSIIYHAIHYHIFMLGSTLYFIYVNFKAARNKETGSIILLAGIAFAFPFLLIDILYAQLVINFGNVANWGAMVLFLSMMIVTAKRFSLALTNGETLSQKLTEMNDNLEQKVKDRTQVIENQKLVLEKQHHSLQQLLKDQETLMAMVAHDLKAPLNRAAGLAEVMSLSGELSEDQLFLNTKIIEVAQQGSKLVEQLNALQKYEQDKKKLVFKDCDIAQLIHNLVEGFQKTAHKKDINLTAEIKVPIQFQTDKDALERILDNLVSNALKFSPRNKTVSISAKVKEGQLTIAVKDEGQGFSEEDKAKAFGKFQTLSAQPTAGEKSTGLGLSIVKILVEKLGGTITLESEQGKGAVFLILLKS
ncbi:sensor histidine kinase [Flexithrix dorotheae]|uniref:sensor histidine kinase n=1 Tax=Flexithrix dorotheae TaxID=70993 RepID=UPI000365DA74|nr:sensor histidine kinase [Flexithrix dorotheae]